MIQTAHFTADLHIDFDPAESTPAEALADYLASSDVSTAFTVVSVEASES